MPQATLADLLTRGTMPNFIYQTNIPFASHNPSFDQPIMQQNANSIDGIIGVDHFSFNTANGGYHKNIHQPSQLADPTAIPNTGQLFTRTLDGQENPFYLSGTGKKYNIVNSSLSGLVTLDAMTPVVALAGIIPDNCIGFLVVQNTIIVGSPNAYHFAFSAYSGNLDVQFSTSYIGNVPLGGVFNQFPISIVQPLVTASAGGAPGSLQLVLSRIGVDITNARWRYIYWPTL